MNNRNGCSASGPKTRRVDSLTKGFAAGAPGVGKDGSTELKAGALVVDSQESCQETVTTCTGSVAMSEQGTWEHSGSLLDGSNTVITTTCSSATGSNADEGGEQQQQQHPRRHGRFTRGAKGSSVSWDDANTSASSIGKSEGMTSTTSPGTGSARSSTTRSVHSSERSLGDDMIQAHKASFGPKSASMRELCKLTFDGEIVGRDAEKALLKEACAQAAAAAPAPPSVAGMASEAGSVSDDDDDDALALKSGRCAPLALVHGYSGAGKTALVEAAVPKDTSKRIFLEGKFDLQNRIVPWAAFVAALSGVPDQLGFLGDAKAKQVKETVLEAVGEDHGLISDLVPALKCLFPERKRIALADAPPAEQGEGSAAAKSKLQYLLTKFISALGTEGCPVILFIDDLQWIDESSLDLLEALATDTEDSSHTFLVGTYRSNEVDDDHILMKKLEVIRDRRGGDVENSSVIDIPLGNLSVSDLSTFLSTTLKRDEDETASLATIIEKKTGGNPFFTIHFLLALQEEGVLEFQLGTLKWVWDEKAIETKFVAANVADLMRRKLIALPQDLQMMLQVCACLGCDFDLRTLELAMSAFPIGTMALNLKEHMEKAITAGVISHSGQIYSFVHDQLQAASFNLIDKEDSNAFQGKIGRAIIDNARNDEVDALLLIAIDLCNCDTAALSLTAADKIKFATLNLRAGQQAIANSAFSSCTSYLQSGIALIEYGIEFNDTRELQINLYGTCAQAHFCNGDYDNMNQCLDTILTQNLTGKEKQPLLLTRMESLVATIQYADCWDLGQRCLEDVVGYRPFPENVSQIQIIASLVKTKYRMKKYRDKIVDLSLLEDETRIFAYKVIEHMVAASYYSGMLVMPLVVFREIRWTMKYGLSETHSPMALTMYSTVLIATNDLKGGAEIGRIAEQLLEKLNPERTLCRCRFILEGLVYHWTKPLAHRVKPLMDGYDVGIRSGHTEEAMWTLFHVIAFSWFSAKKLDDIKAFSIPACKQMKDLGKHAVLLMTLPFVQIVLNLLGQSSEDVCVLTGERMNADEFLSTATETNHLMGLTAMHTLHLELQYLFHNLEAAESLLDKFAPGGKVYPGFYQTVRVAMFEALTCFGVATSKSKSDQKKWWKKGENHLKRIRAWASAGNVNCVHSLCLVEAEQAVSKGDPALAKSRYEQAISTAKRNGFIQDAALAHERAGLFFLAQDDTSWGKYHVEMSIKLYSDWGCKAKVTHLTEKYSDLLSS